MNKIAGTAKIYSNVKLGRNVTIEDYCVIGIPFKTYSDEETVIGDNAVIRSHTVIYAGNTIGNYFQTGNKANIRELNEIMNNVSVGTLSVIEHHVKIGNGVRIHSQVFVPEYCILEDFCWIGPNVVLTNAKYPNSSSAKNRLYGVIVKTGAKIGANSTILPGVVIDRNSLVGAGSVVTKNVPENGVVVGNPAMLINDVSKLPY